MDDIGAYLRNPRWVVAEHVADEALQRYPADVLAIGVYGSLAHGDDTPGSDVNLILVTDRPDSGPAPTAARVEGVPVDVAVIGAEASLRQARTLTPSWPLLADRYVTTKPIHDPSGCFEELRDAHLARLAETTARDFAVLARRAWCQAASAHDRAARFAERHDTDAALVQLGQGRIAAAVVVGLLTRTYFRNSTDAVRRARLAGVDMLELGKLLRAQAEELAERGEPVDATPTALFGEA